MRDEPTGEQLLASAEALLRESLLPALEGSRKTDALMIARAMAIAARQLHNGERAEEEELENLRGLVGDAAQGPGTLRQCLLASNRELCRRIRKGDADDGPLRQQVLAHLRRTTCQRLAESNPRLLGQS